jgi:hypothetical protein
VWALGSGRKSTRGEPVVTERAVPREGPAGTRALCRSYLEVTDALVAGRRPRTRTVRGLLVAATGTDLEEQAADLAAQVDTVEPTALHRWWITAPPSADLVAAHVERGLAAVHRRTAVEEGVPGWKWSWLAEASVAAYEATRQPRFASPVLASFLLLLDERDDRRDRVDVVRGRTLRSWGVPASWWAQHSRGAFDLGWTANVDVAGRIAYPVLRLTRLLAAEGRPVTDDPATSGVVEACAAALREFDDDLDVVAGVGGSYRRAALGDVEPLNHSLVAGRALLELAAVTGDGTARDQATELARFLRWSLRQGVGDAYVWAYRPLPHQPAPARPGRGWKPNRSWKADVDASFALACHEHGLAFDTRDLARFARTFTRGVVLPDGTLNSFISPTRVEPLRRDGATPTERLRAPGVATWNLLGAVDPAVHRGVERAVADHPQVFTRGWFTSQRTVRAYAERLLEVPAVGRPSRWSRRGRRSRQSG